MAQHVEFRRVRRKKPFQGGIAQVNHISLGFLPEPLPGLCQGFAVNRVSQVVPPSEAGLVGPDHDGGPGLDGTAGPVQASEALTQGVQAGALGHQAVEVQVRAHLQALGGDDEAGLFIRRRGRLGTVRQRHLPVAGGHRTEGRWPF